MGHGAFYGLLGGTASAALFHGLSLSSSAVPGIKGGWLDPLRTFRSEMGPNFYMAIVACAMCFALTVGISLATRPNKTDAELTRLAYSLTPRSQSHAEPWYVRPMVSGTVVLAIALMLNLVFT